jgi:hypothetical protein
MHRSDTDNHMLVLPNQPQLRMCADAAAGAGLL